MTKIKLLYMLFLGAVVLWSAPAYGNQELIVSAAASLTNALPEIGKIFEKEHPGTKLVYNFAASGPLLQQIAQGAPVDAFGVGTALAASSDAPTLSGVYKLVEVFEEGGPEARAKFSAEKFTYPGCKQVYRFAGPGGRFEHDLIARCDERYPEAQPLLECVMRQGRRLAPVPPLSEVRERARAQVSSLPTLCRQLHHAGSYPVRTSAKLNQLLEELRIRVAARGIKGR